jgi:hypothetical protein
MTTFLSILQTALLLLPVRGFFAPSAAIVTIRHPSSSSLASRSCRHYYYVVPRSNSSGYSTTISTAAAAPTTVLHHAKPIKQGSIVDNYQTVSVNCNKCGTRLFRYKKKNGTNSNLVKMYVERIRDDCQGILKKQLLQQQQQQGIIIGSGSDSDTKKAVMTLDPTATWECPNCQTNFARSATIHGRPALKLVGGKVRMTKK